MIGERERELAAGEWDRPRLPRPPASRRMRLPDTPARPYAAWRSVPVAGKRFSPECSVLADAGGGRIRRPVQLCAEIRGSGARTGRSCQVSTVSACSSTCSSRTPAPATRSRGYGSLAQVRDGLLQHLTGAGFELLTRTLREVHGWKVAVGGYNRPAYR
jgi:hypothetical protein